MLFPIRPRPENGEATRCYINRVAWSNGYRSLALFREIIPESIPVPLDWVYDGLELDAQERQKICGPLPQEWGPTPVPSLFTSADFNARHQRWCSVCLQEGRAIHWSATLKLVSTCWQHGCWLSDTCPRCHRRQPWPAMPPLYCQCGSSWIGSCLQAPPHFQQLSRAVMQPDGMTSLEGILLSGSHWTRLVRKMAIAFRSDFPRAPGNIADQDTLAVNLEMQRLVIDVISDWPDGLHAMLRKIHGNQVRTTSIQKTFGRLYRILYVDLRGVEFDWLRHGFEKYLNTDWQGLLCARNRRLQKATIEAHPRVPLKQLAVSSGISPLQTARLAQKSLVSAARLPLSEKRTAWTILASDAHQVQHEEFLTLREAANFLGIPRTKFRGLVSENLVSPLLRWKDNGETHRSWIFLKSTIDGLLSSKSKSSKPFHEPVDLRKLLKQWQVTTEEFCDLVRAIQDDVLTCQRSASGHEFDAEQFKAFIRDRRRKSPLAHYSVDQAARILGIKQQVAYELTKASLLKSLVGPNNIVKVTMDAISDFKAKYISLSELAAANKTSPKSLLTKIPVSPVCGPSVDGSRKYYFSREEVRHLLITNK